MFEMIIVNVPAIKTGLDKIILNSEFRYETRYDAEELKGGLTNNYIITSGWS